MWESLIFVYLKHMANTIQNKMATTLQGNKEKKKHKTEF